MSESYRPFTIFLYPFQHQLPAPGKERRKWVEQKLAAHWWPAPMRAAAERFQDNAEGSTFFLKNVRQVLFPGFDASSSATEILADPSGPAARAWLGEQTPLRVTLHAHEPLTRSLEQAARPIGRGRIEAWTFPQEHYEAGWTFDLAWVDAICFGDGAGVLAFKAIPDLRPDDESWVHQHSEFNKAFTLVQPRQKGWTLPRLTMTAPDAEEVPRNDPKQPESPDGDTLAQWLNKLLQPFTGEARYNDTEAAQTRGYRLYTFSVHPAERFVCDAPPEIAGDIPPQDLAAFELAVSQPIKDVYIPGPNYLHDFIQTHRLDFWNDWTLLASQEGVGFAQTLAPGARSPLSHNVESLYADLFVFCLQQRWTLLELQDELDEQTTGRGGSEKLSGLFERFIEFRSRYWFVEITDRPLGNAMFQKMQAALNIPKLFTELGEEIQDLHAVAQNADARRINDVMNIIGFLVLPPSLVIGFLGINLVGITATDEGMTWQEAGLWSAGAVVLAVALGALYKGFRKLSDAKHK